MDWGARINQIQTHRKCEIQHLVDLKEILAFFLKSSISWTGGCPLCRESIWESRHLAPDYS
eukprot:4321703-Ditylum_brightwellii.AAC.1